jgi:hypothetical protein
VNIILEKFKPYIEKIIGDNQNGFRNGRTVIDNMFIVKIINEKIWDYNQSVQDTLWNYMEEFKIHKKLINMCKTCVQKTRIALRVEGTLSSLFFFFK